jgi:hypothetical protein
MEQFLTKLNECNERGIGDVACFQACKYRCAIELIPIISGMQNYLDNIPTFIFKKQD